MSAERFETVRNSSGGGTGHYINDYRCGGSKPLGGGEVVVSAKLSAKDIITALTNTASGRAALAAYVQSVAPPTQAPAATEAPSVPPELDVRRILLAVVPGEDGMGEEVYAESVEMVEAVMTRMAEELEEWQLGMRTLATAATEAPSEPMLVPMKPTDHEECLREVVRVSGFLTEAREDEDIVDFVKRLATPAPAVGASPEVCDICGSPTNGEKRHAHCSNVD